MGKFMENFSFPPAKKMATANCFWSAFSLLLVNSKWTDTYKYNIEWPNAIDCGDSETWADAKVFQEKYLLCCVNNIKLRLVEINWKQIYSELKLKKKPLPFMDVLTVFWRDVNLSNIQHPCFVYRFIKAIWCGLNFIHCTKPTSQVVRTGCSK